LGLEPSILYTLKSHFYI